MKKFKAKIIKAIKNRESFETNLVRVVLGVNPNSVFIIVGGCFVIMIKENLIQISEDITMSSNWVINKKVIDRVNTILSIYDLPQFRHKYFQWYLGNEQWKGTRTFEINNGH